MALPRKSFLLRVDPSLLEAVQRWANDDLRSLNGQIEFVLRRALAQVGRAPGREAPAPDPGAPAAVDAEPQTDGDT
jgi:hypothetical protein